MEATLNILSGDELRSKRHELASKLHEKALAKLDQGEIAEGCKLAETMMKVLEKSDESSLVEPGDRSAQDSFAEQLNKAYADEP